VERHICEKHAVSSTVGGRGLPRKAVLRHSLVTSCRPHCLTIPPPSPPPSVPPTQRAALFRNRFLGIPNGFVLNCTSWSSKSDETGQEEGSSFVCMLCNFFCLSKIVTGHGSSFVCMLCNFFCLSKIVTGHGNCTFWTSRIHFLFLNSKV
jgi:hypothetical protein